jgi:hypothetical protein
VEHSELLTKVAVVLEKLRVPYMVVGSTASIIYGEPRLTNAIDIVVNLLPQHIETFCAEFPSPEHYLSRAAVESAVAKRFQFNLIHPGSGLKVDFILSRRDAFDESRMRRAQFVLQDESTEKVRFASPEDVIIKKMEFFQLGESEKHIRDICGILRAQADKIDRAYIQQWADKLGLTEVWNAILARMAAD